MTSQLRRSTTRKRLTELCAAAMIEYLSAHTTSHTPNEQMKHAYRIALKITLGNAIEAITNQNIPLNLIENGAVLSLFSGATDKIADTRQNDKVVKVREYIQDNIEFLVEEDLGGVSELFSGHRALWIQNKLKLVHDPARREAGKIYTPFDVTEYMCSNVAKAMISRCGSLEELLKMKILDPAIGSGAFCSQLVRVLWKKASRKWKLKDEANVFISKLCKLLII